MGQTLKTIYIITIGGSKFDRVEDPFLYSPLVTTSLLKSFRCILSIINEEKAEDAEVSYRTLGAVSAYRLDRKKRMTLNYLKADSEKTFHNFPVVEWIVSKVNEKTEKFLTHESKGSRKYLITAYRIKIG